MKNVALEQQIDNCEKLLELFQIERENYMKQSEIEMSEVLGMMKQKQELLTIFDHYRQELKKQHKDNSELDRMQLRKLGALIEQLLVIDQENEILIKKLISSTKQTVTNKARERERPALKQQLPLAPKSKPVPVSMATSYASSLQEQLLGSERYI